MNQRSLLLAATLLLPAAALLLFGPRGRVSAPSGRTVVHYWEKWTLTEGRAISDLVQRFNDTAGRERSIWVDYHAVSNIEQRLLIATAGGDPPDLAGLIDSRVPQYADQDALLPLDELVAESDVQLDAFKPVWIELCRFNGALYALPSTPFTIALYYNRRLFREAGLDPDRPPATTAELAEFARRLTRYEQRGADRVIVQLGFTVSPAMLGWWHWVWPCFFGERLWDGRQFACNTPSGRRAAEWIAGLRRDLGLEAVLNFEAGAGPIESAQNPFLAERLAMVFQGPWLAKWISTYAPHVDYGVAAFPSEDGRERVFASCDVFVIPRGARHPREAMIFLEWLMQQPMLEELCRVHGKVSPFRTPLPEFFADHPNPHIRTFDALAASPGAFGFPRMPMWAQAEMETLAGLQDILRGNRNAASALEFTQKRIDAAVADYQRMKALRGSTQQ